MNPGDVLGQVVGINSGQAIPAAVGDAMGRVTDAAQAASNGSSGLEIWASDQIAAIGQAMGRAGREVAIYAGFVIIIGICIYVIVAEEND